MALVSDIREDLWLPYLPTDNPSRASAYEEAEREHVISSMSAQLHRVLELEDDEFWGFALSSDGLHAFLDSYLKNARRRFDMLTGVSDGAADAPADTVLSQRVLLILERLAGRDSAPAAVRETFAACLYDNWIFDCAKILDICVLYGFGAEAERTAKILESVFSTQEEYLQDLAAAVRVFHHAVVRIGKEAESSDIAAAAARLPAIKSIEVSVDASPLEQQRFLLEGLVGFERLVSLCPLTCGAVHRAGGVLCCAVAHDAAIDTAFKHAGKSDAKDICRHAALQCAAHILNVLFLDTASPWFATELSAEDGMAESVDSALVHSLIRASQAVSQPRLVRVLGRWKDLRERIDSLADDRNALFVLSLMRSEDAPSGQSGADGSVETDESEQLRDNLVSQVRDILPDLGNGFIEVCLRQYGFDVETTIHHIVENDLPSAILELPRALETAPSLAVDEEIATAMTRFDRDDAARFVVAHAGERVHNAHIGKNALKQFARAKNNETKTTKRETLRAVAEMDRRAAIAAEQREREKQRAQSRALHTGKSVEETTYEDEYDDSLEAYTFTGVDLGAGELGDGNDGDQSAQIVAQDALQRSLPQRERFRRRDRAEPSAAAPAPPAPRDPPSIATAPTPQRGRGGRGGGRGRGRGRGGANHNRKDRAARKRM